MSTLYYQGSPCVIAIRWFRAAGSLSLIFLYASDRGQESNSLNTEPQPSFLNKKRTSRTSRVLLVFHTSRGYPGSGTGSDDGSHAKGNTESTQSVRHEFWSKRTAGNTWLARWNSFCRSTYYRGYDGSDQHKARAQGCCRNLVRDNYISAITTREPSVNLIGLFILRNWEQSDNAFVPSVCF